ncbi:MAG: DUF1579 family protein [Acidobacteriota bacterium]
MKILITLLSVLLLPPLPVAADSSADEIVERYIAARGGVDAWRAVDTMAIRGRHVNFSDENDFELLRQRPDHFRMRFTQLGNPVVFGHDATGSWWRFPLFGFSWAWRTPGNDAVVLARLADFEPALFDAHGKGHQVELIGEDEVDGTPTIALRLTRDDGATETWHLDPETHLEVAVDETVWDLTQGPHDMNRRTYFDEFRAVDGVVIPHYMEQEYGARHVVIYVDNVDVNPDIDGDPFSMPPPRGMEALRTIAGTWDLTMSRPDPRSGEWVDAANADVSIETALDGMILREHYQSTADGGLTWVTRDWSWDRFREHYRIVVGDSFTGRLDILEGTNAEDEWLVVDDVASGTSISMRGQVIHRQERIQIESPDRFVIERHRSIDGGESWQLEERHTYDRSVP